MRPDPRPSALHGFKASDGSVGRFTARDYAMRETDTMVIADATGGEITVTLPPVASLQTYRHTFKFVRVCAFSNSFNFSPITVRISGGSTFRRGGTSRVIYDACTELDFVGSYLGWTCITAHHAGVQVRRNAAWAAASFATATAIPFDVLDYRSNQDVLTWDATAPTQIVCNVGAHAHISGWGRIDSTAGGDYSVRVQVYQNGVAVDSIDTAASGWAARDSGFAFGSAFLDVAAGDVLDLRLHQANLTGGLAMAAFSVALNL